MVVIENPKTTLGKLLETLETYRRIKNQSITDLYALDPNSTEFQNLSSISDHAFNTFDSLSYVLTYLASLQKERKITALDIDKIYNDNENNVEGFINAAINLIYERREEDFVLRIPKDLTKYHSIYRRIHSEA